MKKWHACLVVALASVAIGASSPTPTPGRANVGQNTDIDIDLPANGTLGDLAAILKEKYPRYTVNVSPQNASQVKIGPIKLRGTSFQVLLGTLREASRGRYTVEESNNDSVLIHETPVPTPPPVNMGFGDMPIISIDLPPGATMKDLTSLITKNYPTVTCTLSDPGLGDLKVGELRLRNVPLVHLPETVISMFSGRFRATVQGNTLSFMSPGQNLVNAFNITAWLGDVPDDMALQKTGQLGDRIKATILAVDAMDDRNQYEVPKCIYVPSTKVYMITGEQLSVMFASRILKTLVPGIAPAPTK
ncbi:MAG TPA: hypothetical protein VG733_17865 [Chthoniobacteraceae bacterium]|nr:hypothetical protein [Chthoniobacteraceae bacterium]